jgi:hypothetical protein
MKPQLPALDEHFHQGSSCWEAKLVLWRGAFEKNQPEDLRKKKKLPKQTKTCDPFLITLANSNVFSLKVSLQEP